MNTLIVIPARMASTRLPRKMLADICGKPLVQRTIKSVLSSGYEDVIVACDCVEIADATRSVGIEAVLTDPELASGTDRVYAAYKIFDTAKKYDFILNVQGDMPFVNPDLIKYTASILHSEHYDITTMGTSIKNTSYLNDSVVKPAVSLQKEQKSPDFLVGNALYFSRSPIPFGGPYYHHVGIYGFSAESLEKFVSLPQSRLEKIERLEQLRALENGMSIGIGLIEAAAPISVDTAEDLKRAREFYEENPD